MQDSVESIAASAAAALSCRLPGEDAHTRLSPVAVEGEPLPSRRGSGRPAAGLLLLYPTRHGPSVLLTVRSRSLPNHRGQVSLPGGIVERDESLEQAALREAHEEVAIDPKSVTVLGALSPLYIPVTGFTLTPFLGMAGERPEFAPNPAEVGRVLEVPLRHVAEGKVQWERRTLLGRECAVPYIPFAGEKIWGATGMILVELMWILGNKLEVGEPPR